MPDVSTEATILYQSDWDLILGMPDGSVVPYTLKHPLASDKKDAIVLPVEGQHNFGNTMNIPAYLRTETTPFEQYRFLSTAHEIIDLRVGFIKSRKRWVISNVR